MTKTTHPGKKTSSSPRKKKPIPHQLRRTRLCLSVANSGSSCSVCVELCEIE
jgi:hypothetical protein